METQEKRQNELLMEARFKYSMISFAEKFLLACKA